MKRGWRRPVGGHAVLGALTNEVERSLSILEQDSAWLHDMQSLPPYIDMEEAEQADI